MHEQCVYKYIYVNKIRCKYADVGMDQQESERENL